MVADMSRLLGGKPLLRKGYGVSPLMQFEAVIVEGGRVNQGGIPIQHPADGLIEDKSATTGGAGGMRKAP